MIPDGFDFHRKSITLSWALADISPNHSEIDSSSESLTNIF